MNTTAAQSAADFDPVNVDTLIRVVSAETGVPYGDILSNRMDRPAANARQIVMTLARDELAMSLPVIGGWLGNRHHSTVLSGIRAHAVRVLRDPVLAAKSSAARATFAQMRTGLIARNALGPLPSRRNAGALSC